MPALAFSPRSPPPGAERNAQHREYGPDDPAGGLYQLGTRSRTTIAGRVQELAGADAEVLEITGR